MEKLSKIFGNTVIFVVIYIVFMIPTYLLPYLGSNSFVLGLSPFFWPHLISLIVLVTVTWFRGSNIDKKWLVIFPILALVFDLVPGLSSVPFVPSVMHLLAIILGVAGVKQTVAISSSKREPNDR